MSLARLKATGRGRIHMRVTIEGLPLQFVSTRAMQRTLSDGRARIAGLKTEGISLGARADLRAARLEAKGIELKLLDLDRLPGSRHGRLTRELWQRPTAETFLAAEAAPADTTLTVYDATVFPTSGVVHIGTEAILYTGTTATTLTGCTRGAWDTIAQRHFVADGEGIGDARVTDRPQGVEGRRVYVTLYGDGDDPQGNGHARWRGVCATDLRWDNGTWTVGVDPITRLFSQPLGSDSSDEVRLRGIHYDVAHPWVLLIQQPSTGLSATASVVGFFETERDFTTAATSAIATALARAGISLGVSGSLVVAPIVGGYRITYTAHSSGSPHHLVVTQSPVFVPSPDGYEMVSLRAGSSLEMTTLVDLQPVDGGAAYISIGAGFPRGAIGQRNAYAPPGLFGDDDWSWTRIYLAAYSVPGAGSALAIKNGDVEEVFTVASADAGTRSVRIVHPGFSKKFDERSLFSVGAALGRGNVVDLLTNILAVSPDNANAGTMPLLGMTDITWTQDVVDALESAPLCNGRTWVAFDQTTLADVIEPELIALGAYMRLSLSGQIQIDMLRPALSTDAAAWTIDDSQAMGATIERGGFGTLGLVRYRFEYDPREDEWRRTLSVRDVQNASATRAPIETTIEQRSMGVGGGISSGGEVYAGIPPTLESIQRIAVNQFAFFGTDYSVINLGSDPRLMDARIGDVVALTSSMLPDTSDGTSKIDARGVRIVRQELSVETGRVELELLLHSESFAGYHFGALIQSASVVSGFTYDITPHDGYSDGDRTAHLYAGMAVVAVEGDSATPASVSGTVVSIVSVNVVRVAFASAPSFTGDWVLRADIASLYDETSEGAALVFVADSVARIDFAFSRGRARVFA